jgi:O-acetyl-ADP-ribose deacetylase (regulator of RNase III)
VKRLASGVGVECVQGDITSQDDVVAVVNAANAGLQSGGGVAGAIHRVAGPGLEEEARALAPIIPGDAVITSGHGLPNRYVIHTLGPVYGQDRPEAELLASCYRNSLALAEEHGIESVAFPAISTGIYGFPPERAAPIAVEAAAGALADKPGVNEVIFCCFGARSAELHCRALAARNGSRDAAAGG